MIKFCISLFIQLPGENRGKHRGFVIFFIPGNWITLAVYKRRESASPPGGGRCFEAALSVEGGRQAGVSPSRRRQVSAS